MESVDLLKIHGVSTRRYKKLQKKKISTIEDLIGLTPKTLGQFIEIDDPLECKNILKRATLYHEHSINILTSLDLPNPSESLYFDIEAYPSRDKEVFLIGFGTNTNSVKSFFKAPNFKQDVADFLNESDKKYLVSSSGNNWDFKSLQGFLGGKEEVLGKFLSIDLMRHLQSKIISPVGFSVKKFSQYLGYGGFEGLTNSLKNDPKFSSPIPDTKLGYFLGKLIESRNYSPVVKQTVIKYNIADVKALAHIHYFLIKFIRERTGILEI